jgi:hypothetical protein
MGDGLLPAAINEQRFYSPTADGVSVEPVEECGEGVGERRRRRGDVRGSLTLA